MQKKKWNVIAKVNNVSVHASRLFPVPSPRLVDSHLSAFISLLFADGLQKREMLPIWYQLQESRSHEAINHKKITLAALQQSDKEKYYIDGILLQSIEAWANRWIFPGWVRPWNWKNWKFYSVTFLQNRESSSTTRDELLGRVLALQTVRSDLHVLIKNLLHDSDTGTKNRFTRHLRLVYDENYTLINFFICTPPVAS